MSWLAYLMTDARYAVYALMLPVVFCLVVIASKSVAIAAGMDWLGERAYSSYLVGQIAIQLVAGAAFALKVYVPILIFIPLTMLIMLLLTDLFYRCVESKCKNVRLPSFQKHYFKKAV
jgi:peptidoglycan/LPS O-acetylase OafA/YrhL